MVDAIIIIIILPEVHNYDPSGDIIVVIEYYCLEGQASSSIAEGKVPRKVTRLIIIIIIIIINNNPGCLGMVAKLNTVFGSEFPFPRLLSFIFRLISNRLCCFD